MVRINKIYTKTGDGGETHLVGGKRVRKSSKRVSVTGEIDELNCVLGWVVALANNDESTEIATQLSDIQSELFDLGAHTSSIPGEKYAAALTITSEDVERLEKSIDEFVKDLPELKSFILPGGNELISAIHLARAVCRRAERCLVGLLDEEKVDNLALQYLNRLSDLLFAMARFECKRSGLAEILWKPKSKK